MTQYTKEFREQAILLSDEIGVKKAAEQLGVVYSTLVDWRKLRNSMKKEKAAVSTEPLTEREKELMKEIAARHRGVAFLSFLASMSSPFSIRNCRENKFPPEAA